MEAYIIFSGMFMGCIIGGLYEYKKVNEWNKISMPIMVVLIFLSWVGCGVQLYLWRKYPPTKF